MATTRTDREAAEQCRAIQDAGMGVWIDGYPARLGGTDAATVAALGDPCRSVRLDWHAALGVLHQGGRFVSGPGPARPTGPAFVAVAALRDAFRPVGAELPVVIRDRTENRIEEAMRAAIVIDGARQGRRRDAARAFAMTVGSLALVDAGTFGLTTAGIIADLKYRDGVDNIIRDTLAALAEATASLSAIPLPAPADEPAEDGQDDAPDPEACPGCGKAPGDHLTADCAHPNGCGYWRTLTRSLVALLGPPPLPVPAVP